jgi:hypothetical protein
MEQQPGNRHNFRLAITTSLTATSGSAEQHGTNRTTWVARQNNEQTGNRQ